MKRKDPHLQELVDLLDERLRDADGNVSVAFESLSKAEEHDIEVEISKCVESCRYYLEQYHTIIPKSTGMPQSVYPFKESQDIFFETVMREIASRGRVRCACLKARQLTISTTSEGILSWKTFFNQGCHSLIIAQDDDQTDYLLGMAQTAYDGLPWWMRPEARYERKGRYLLLDKKDAGERRSSPGLKSAIYAENANALTGVAVGKAIRVLHACLAPSTLVRTSDGRCSPISSLVAGDRVMGNAGMVTVTAAWSSDARKLFPTGPTGYRVKTWSTSGIETLCTPNHQWLVAESQVETKDRVYRPRGVAWATTEQIKTVLAERKKSGRLKDKVWMAYPVREVSEGYRPPQPEVEGSKRRQGGGRYPRPVGVGTGREWGYAIGIYLAEGSIDRNNQGRNVARICLSLDRDEEHLASRFARATGVPFTVHRSKVSRTIICRFSNSSLARWFKSNIGEKDDKILPDWAWRCGRDFLTGVVEGMVLGDGHEGSRRITFTSTRRHLAVAFRDALLSLGFGLASLGRRDAGHYYGRNCQERWTVVLCEPGQRTFSEQVLGREADPGTVGEALHWAYSDDMRWVYSIVKSVEPCHLEKVWDIEVDHPDHAFLLDTLTSSNSELPLWNDPSILNEQVFPTMQGISDDIRILESTARGRDNFWYRFWRRVVNGNVEGWIPIFIESYRLKEYSLPVPRGTEFVLTADEKAARKKVLAEKAFRISDEHFNWRRSIAAETEAVAGQEDKMSQEYPMISWVEAFQASGICAFNKKRLHSILTADCKKPKFTGEISLSDDRRANIDGMSKFDEHKSLPSTDVVGDRMWVWEEPVEGETYFVAADPAGGIIGADYSAVQVIRIGRGLELDEQVAEWHGWINPTPFARVVAAVGYWYNEAQIACEVNGKIGGTTNTVIVRELGYENIFVWKRYDKIKNFMTDFFGWETNHKNREMIIAKFREAIDECTLLIRSENLIEECFNFGNADGYDRTEAQSGNDDLVMAAMICSFCAHDSEWGQKAAASPRPEGDARPASAGNVRERMAQVQDRYNEAAAKRDKAQQRLIASRVVVPVRKSRASTEYSPIHDRPGSVANRLVSEMNVPAEYAQELETHMGDNPFPEDVPEDDRWKTLW